METLQVRMSLLPWKSEWDSFLCQLLDVDPYQDFELDLDVLPVKPIQA